MLERIRNPRRADFLIWIVLVVATLALVTLIVGKGGSRLGPEYQVIQSATPTPVPTATPFAPAKSFALSSPTDSDSILLWHVPYAITITGWDCIVDPGDSSESVVLDLQETNSTGDSGVTIDATVTCDNDGATDDGSLSNPTLDSGDYLLLDVGTVTGTVSWVTGSFQYTIN